jgi:alpha-glucosidase (family GH31 glycosyl hydrolase)
MLDLYFFPGPSPEDVINQYLALIGKPFLPAYWALGFQVENIRIYSTTVITRV